MRGLIFILRSNLKSWRGEAFSANLGSTHMMIIAKSAWDFWPPDRDAGKTV